MLFAIFNVKFRLFWYVKHVLKNVSNKNVCGDGFIIYTTACEQYYCMVVGTKLVKIWVYFFCIFLILCVFARRSANRLSFPLSSTKLNHVDLGYGNISFKNNCIRSVRHYDDEIMEKTNYWKTLKINFVVTYHSFLLAFSNSAY